MLILFVLAAILDGAPEPAPPTQEQCDERYYPKQAAEQNIEGRAVIHCTVTTTGRLRDCTVVSEEPAGQGFGAKALCLSALFQMRPATRDGVPMEGEVNIPLRFDLPRDKPSKKSRAN